MNKSIKRSYIYLIIILLIINLITLLGYSKIILPHRIDLKYNNLEATLIKTTSNINKDIINNDFKTLASLVSNIKQTYEVEIILRDLNSNIIYKEDNLNYEKYYYTSVIKFKEESYLMSIASNSKITRTSFVKNFIMFQISLIFIIVAVSGFITHRKFLHPLENIIKDMNNYQKNIKPRKKRVNNKIDELQNSFVDLVDNLEDEKQKQKTLIASISHDIKTPLTSIIGYTDRLKSIKLDKETKIKYLDKIYNKSLDMKKIIENFDDFLVIGKSTIDLEPIKVKDLLDIIKDSYHDDLKTEGIELIINDNCNEQYINVDISELKRVFGNIINNSIRHFDNINPVITISCNNTKNDIEFIISDNGTGITDLQIEKIFDPLYTSDYSRKIAGLGLSICKSIIESMDGTIFALNIVGDGLSIHFKLPKMEIK